MRDTLNPASGPVLVAAALIVSPALWHGMILGELPLDVALTRYLVAVVGCWFALGLFLQFLPEPAGRNRDVADRDAADRDVTREPALPATPSNAAEGTAQPGTELAASNDPYAS